jgi:hypothetical protein
MKKRIRIYAALITFCIIIISAFNIYAYEGDTRTVSLVATDKCFAASSWIYGTENNIYLKGSNSSKSANNVVCRAAVSWQGIICTAKSFNLAPGKSLEGTYLLQSTYDWCPSRVQLEAQYVAFPYGNVALGKIVD